MNFETTNEYDISVIVTAHAEGRLAHRTMRSIEAAIAAAEAIHLRSEIIIVLDNPTAETLAYFERWRDKAHVLEVNNRDPGINRNVGAEVARGKYVAIIDADDLFGRDWLALAYKRAEESSLEHFIVHAQFTIFFENRQAIARYFASNSAGFNKQNLMEVNHWTSVVFARRATFIKCPFFPTESNSGFGYEDWHWITTVLAIGGEVLIAPTTCKFIRYKQSGSRLSFHNANRALLPPTMLLDPRQFLELTAGHNNGQGKVKRDDAQRPLSWSERAQSLKHKVSRLPRVISRATEWCPPVQKAMGKVYRWWVGYGIRRSMLPSEIIEQWTAVAKIEPQLYPNDSLLEKMEWFEHSSEPSVEVYAQMCHLILDSHPESVGPQFTHIFLVPWLKADRSGFDTINRVRLIASNPANRVLVIATEDADSPWKKRLPATVHCIDIHKTIQVLSPPKRRHLLAQILIQMQPKVIHLINSGLGNQAFELYGRALSQTSKLYATTFCADIEPSGAFSGYAITSLPEYEDYLTAITADNQRICDYLAETFAIDPAKMVVHYQPVQLKELPQRNRSQSDTPFQVLWAGRLDRQKRPDLMLEIARRCRSDNMQFHVYGTSVITDDWAKVDFNNLPNVTYHGTFDGLHSIEPAKFDVFLNTSQWDGMPNILLEAVAEGLPIVTSDVGGIGELIVQDETGLIVHPFDDIERYVVELRRLMQDPALGERLLLASRQLVAERHSWEHFAADLNRLPGYLAGPCQLERAELSRLEQPPLQGSSLKEL
jgi:glycosyltransferase involved in cell wall biosynthesis